MEPPRTSTETSRRAERIRSGKFLSYSKKWEGGQDEWEMMYMPPLSFEIQIHLFRTCFELCMPLKWPQLLTHPPWNDSMKRPPFLSTRASGQFLRQDAKPCLPELLFKLEVISWQTSIMPYTYPLPEPFGIARRCLWRHGQLSSAYAARILN